MMNILLKKYLTPYVKKTGEEEKENAIKTKIFYKMTEESDSASFIITKSKLGDDFIVGSLC